MSLATVAPAEPRQAFGRRFLSWLGTGLRLIWTILSSPFRLFLSFRRSMTGASATLLVISIVTWNIIWGYPWVGMFSTCMSLLLVGWIMNRLMCPKLDFHLVLPRSAMAEHPISIGLQARNPGRLPAMDFSVDFASLSGLSRRKQRRQSKVHGLYQVLSPPNSLSMLEAGQQARLTSTIVFQQRGIYFLPHVVVTSYFPFHLFRSFRRHPTETQIAITPRPLTGEEDAAARGMLEALGGWSHRLLSGDALDYTGSREYQVGMPVRRWDFNSWARLGRPIVREFQSPSVQLVTLIVDTAGGTSSSKTNGVDPSLERVLSLAATAILSLSQKMVRVRLCVTSEELLGAATTSDVLPASDSESMLIRLADAKPVSEAVADRRLADAIELVGRSPALVLTSRDQQDFGDALPPGVRWLRVDPAGTAFPVAPPHSKTARPAAAMPHTETTAAGVASAGGRPDSVHASTS